MLIEKLELVGYKRFSLNHITELVYTPKNKLQLILGSNGSGKSSMLSELTPLPSVASDFPNGGYKKIEISHHNNKYILTNTFNNPGNRYSFVKNEEELNPSGGIRIYQELVKQEFNITPDIHEVMLGTKSFNSMTVAERRQWFTKLSDVDYTYALGYFKRLTSHIRDLEGTVKTLQSRLVQETEKVLNEEEEKTIRDRITELKDLINKLLDIKVTPPTGFDSFKELETQLNCCAYSINKHAKYTQGLRKHFLIDNVDYNFTQVEDIQQALTDIQQQIQQSVNEQKVLYSLIERERKIVDAIENNKISDIQTLDTEVQELSNQIKEIEKKLLYDLTIENPKEAHNNLISVYPELRGYISELPNNKEVKISREDFIKLKENRVTEVTELDKLEKTRKQINSEKEELEHLKNHDETVCPKCSYKWHKGYNEQRHKQLTELLNRVDESIVKRNESIEKIDEALETLSYYINIYTKCRELMSHTPSLKAIWGLVLDYFHEDPSRALLTIDNASNDLICLIEKEQLVAKVNELTKLKEDITSTKQQDISKKKDYLNELDTSYTKEIHKMQSLQKEENRIKELLDIYERFLENRTGLETHLVFYDKLLDTKVYLYFQNYVRELIQNFRLELNEKEQLVSKIDIQKALVKDIQKQIDQHKEVIEVGKLAIKELSPNEGLIAKGLTNFINIFVSRLNFFIKKIWSYTLELVPVLPDEDGLDLDYKFAVKVGDEGMIPDISKASTAMKEVIDLAFKIVAMEYLGMKNYPLYLDEIGANMDYKHKKDAFTMISNIAMMSDFSQIFLISHNEHSYSTLSNADITVLCSANIVPPKNGVFNECCIMK